MKTQQVRNPLKFRCASNEATPDYVIYDDFRMFVAYGLMCCWLSHTGDDPNADCNMARPVTRDDVKELRDFFLSLLETSIVALWKKQYEPGDGDVEGSAQYLIIGSEELGQEETFINWNVCFQDDSIMYVMGCTGADDEAIWLSYRGIEDRQNVLQVLTEARQSIDDTVWPTLVEEAAKKVKFYECGGCGAYHRADWNGDCREDENRFASPEQMAIRLGLTTETDEDKVRYDHFLEEVDMPGCEPNQGVHKP